MALPAMGYGTPFHQEALQRHGPTPLHQPQLVLHRRPSGGTLTIFP
ncbi:MAG: hypothetical protein U1E16_04835 [Hyphomicrobiales bacterium]